MTTQRVDGCLFIDAKNVRAQYRCYRPSCPHPQEGPVYGADVGTFVAGIKTQHLATHHGSTP